MTSNAHPSSARSRRRGTRGFAAFVTVIAGLVSLAVGAVVLPATSLDPVVLNWLIPLAIAFGIAHFVAVVGLVRNRRWAARLTGYLSAIGIGLAAYGLLVTLTGLDPFGATSSLPAHEARAEGLGLMVWMIGLWLVAARFAFRGIVPTGRPVDRSAGLAAAAA
jgi:uncharacterized membrane protein YagU involved in acid resistance